MSTNRNKRGTILVVEDDAAALDALGKLLAAEGYAVALAADGQAALDHLAEHAPDVVVTDLKMPRLDGMALLEKLRADQRDVPVIVVTSSHELSAAVNAMKRGADDYLTKPVDVDALLLAIERALERHQVRVEAENLRRQLRERDAEGLQGLIGASLPMQRVYRVARQVAPSRATVLITGESGTGKGELAHAIHRLGPRAPKPFVTLHCAALPESLLESELFGHEKGAFTGADRRRAGRFELAHGGTLFLDEIGEISPLTQVKLLRVLQERTFERVGGSESIAVDVRVIAATNRDLPADVASGKFREDLFYRLNVVAIEMPPLRTRGGDIVALADHFLQKFVLDNHKRIAGFTEAARQKLLRHRWPGNVRALENAIERAVVLCEGERIDEADLPFEAPPPLEGPLQIPGSTMAEIERYAITQTLESVDGSTARAAEVLDVSIRTIQYRLSQYGLTSRDFGKK